MNGGNSYFGLMISRLSLFVIAFPVFMWSAAISAATITVNYNEQSSVWPANAKTAFDKAVEMWEDDIFSPFEIKIDAYYEDFSATGNAPANVLGYARSNALAHNFGSAHPAYFNDFNYVIALAEKLRGVQFTNWTNYPYHIEIRMNSAIAWDFSIAFNPTQNHYDFISTAAHELAHGIGFSASSTLDNNSGLPIYKSSGTPKIMDKYIVRVNNGTTSLTSLPSAGPNTEAFLTSDQVYFDGLFSVSTNGGSKPRLFAPSPYQQGSSISHWNQGEYSLLDDDAMMHPAAGFSSVDFHRHLGDVTVSFMRDIGWDIWANGMVRVKNPINLVVFPNPSRGHYSVRSATEKITSVVICDMQGNLVQQHQFQNKPEILIYLDNESIGIYTARIGTDSSIHFVKLIKTK